MRLALALGLACLAGGIIAVIVLGRQLAAPRQTDIGPPPADLPVELVLIPRDGAAPVSGWFVAGDPRRGAVLLLHDVRSDRREMLGRARFLHEAGYSALLIDLQAHGETPGDHITFGHREALDAHAALGYLRSRRPGLPIGVIGVSLGGAAALLGEAPLSADAMVLEAVYSSIETAIGNRIAIRLGEPARFLAPLLLLQIEPSLGIAPGALSPSSAIRRVSAPLMIIAGSADQRTRARDTALLFAMAPDPKWLWMVEGAAHQDLHRFAPREYERRVLEFLRQRL